MLKHYSTETDHFFTESCGIYRHEDDVMQCYGRYRLVPIGATYDFITFADLSRQSGYKDHPFCVVDDFGSLVKVPA